MEFRLFYDGPLKANGTPTDKHLIRQAVHTQLHELLARRSMVHLRKQIDEKEPRATFISIGQFNFVPLISEKLSHVAELHITFLTPEEPGRVITQGGDLDNRLKTLLDALRCPKNSSELPGGAKPAADEVPFFCLLEDDMLVSALSVTTDRLLRPGEKAANVVLIIQVVPRSTHTSLGTVIWV